MAKIGILAGICCTILGLACGVSADTLAYQTVPINGIDVPDGTRCVNDNGQVIGKVAATDKTAGSVYHAALWDAAHGVKDLGTLGGSMSDATAINDAGVVVGYSYIDKIDPDAKTPIQHACVWYPGKKPIDLCPKDSKLASCVWVINDGGVIAGSYGADPAIFQPGKKPIILPRPACFDKQTVQFIMMRATPDGTIYGWGWHLKSIDLLDAPTSIHMIRWSADGKKVEDLGIPPHSCAIECGFGYTDLKDEQNGIREWADINSAGVTVGFRHHYSKEAYEAGYDPELPGVPPALLSPQPVYWSPHLPMDMVLDYPNFAKLHWSGYMGIDDPDYRPDVFLERAAINDNGTMVMPVPDRVMPGPPVPAIVDKLRKEGKNVIVEAEQPQVVKGTLYLWSKYDAQPVDLSKQVGLWLTTVFGMSENGTIVAGASAYAWKSRKSGDLTTYDVSENTAAPYLLIPLHAVDASQSQGADGTVTTGSVTNITNPMN